MVNLKLFLMSVSLTAFHNPLFASNLYASEEESNVRELSASPSFHTNRFEEIPQVYEQAYKLSPKEVNDFFETGYVVIKGFFAAEEVKKSLEGAAYLQEKAIHIFKAIKKMLPLISLGTLPVTGRIEEDETPFYINKIDAKGSYHIEWNGTQFVIGKAKDQTQIQRIVWAGAARPDLLKISRQEKLLTIVAQLLGADKADHLINQLHYKLPHDGVKFDWHQDIKNRRQLDENWTDVNGSGSFVQTIIALQDMGPSLNNGPLMVVPGLPKEGDLFLDNIKDPDELKRMARIEQAVPLTLKAGDMVLMHPLLIHGSEPNKSSFSRLVLINGFAYPGANTLPYPGKGSCEEITLPQFIDIALEKEKFK